MVSSITSTPYYSYLNQLQGIGNPASPSTPATSPAAPATTGASLVSSLLGGGYTPEVLSLLQENNGDTFNPVTDLLGGTGTNNALTQLYSSLYDSAAAANITQAQENSAPGSPVVKPGTTAPATAGNSAQDLINAQIQASVAYNKTLQQNVANTVASIVQA